MTVNLRIITTNYFIETFELLIRFWKNR